MPKATCCGRLTRGSWHAAAQQLRRGGAESLADRLSVLVSQPQHEQRAAELLHRLLPELPISLSSEVLPEYREYERTATTLINAYVQPLVARYLARLEEALAAAPVRALRIMQSNGGVIDLRQAAEHAARLVLSGPAGGAVGAFAVARSAADSPVSSAAGPNAHLIPSRFSPLTWAAPAPTSASVPAAFPPQARVSSAVCRCACR